MATDAGYAGPSFLAEPDWVSANHRNPSVRLIDCGAPSCAEPVFPSGRRSKTSSCLARYLPVHPLLEDAGSAHVHLMEPDDFAETMRSLGRSKETTVWGS